MHREKNDCRRIPIKKSIFTIFMLHLFYSAATFSQNPLLKPNLSWININGTVISANDDSFRLDYGNGVITVKMDDWDWYAEAAGIIEGDKVAVYGRIDDDFYEKRTIEASTVYVEDLNTYFYASSTDEEDWQYRVNPLVVASWIELTGVITDVDGREFTLDTGKRDIRVDTYQMSYNPLDQYGFQKLKKGDLVRVSGEVEHDILEKREILADSIVTLVKDEGKSDAEDESEGS